MSTTFFEGIMYVQFMSCVQGDWKNGKKYSKMDQVKFMEDSL